MKEIFVKLLFLQLLIILLFSEFRNCKKISPTWNHKLALRKTLKDISKIGSLHNAKSKIINKVKFVP